MNLFSKKLDIFKNYWEPFLAIIAITISIIALLQSCKSNTLSEESNEIAKNSHHLAETSIAKSNSSQMKVIFLSSSYEFFDVGEINCNENLEHKKFSFEYALLFEISNILGKTNTFSKIDYNPIINNFETHRVFIDYEYWKTSADFEEWLISKEKKLISSDNSFENLQNAVVEGPTIVINGGEAQRVLIKGKLTFFVYEGTKMKDFLSNIYVATWPHNINFIFSDETIISVPYNFPNPFKFSDNFLIDDFSSCN